MPKFYSIDTSIITPGVNNIVDVTRTLPLRSIDHLVVKAPDEVQDSALTGLTSLLSAKYAAIAASKPNYTRINTFDCLDSVQFNTTTSNKAYFGGGFRHASIPPGGMIATATATLSGSVPNFCVGTWELYHLTDTESAGPSASRPPYSRVYQDISPDNATVLVSFDGGLSYNPLANNAEFSIPVGQQGLSMIVHLSNSDSTPFYLGSLVIWSTLLT